VGDQVSKGDLAVDDEARNLSKAAGAERPRAVDGELPVDDLAAEPDDRAGYGLVKILTG
jgi:hypothetical protein